MYKVSLPISKSIANRILLLQAIHGDELMPVSADMPDDVIVLHDALRQLRDTYGTPDGFKQSQAASSRLQQAPLVLHLKNCGTALRFLQVHLDKCYPGVPVTLTGDPRLMERNGRPTTQTLSARILHGEDIPAEDNESPYVTMSRCMAQSYSVDPQIANEPDWSAAAFWYEYVAIHGGELVLEGLKRDSLQGDKAVVQIYSRYFGVITSYLPEGVKICQSAIPVRDQVVAIDFEHIPDLYPAIAYTCERLELTLRATGTSRLRFKESNRLTAVRLHEVRNDHRMAMALLCAGFPVPAEEQACVVKSYPRFWENFTRISIHSRRPDDGRTTVGRQSYLTLVTHATPVKGVNDDNLGKKHALSKLIRAASTEYVWLHDDDVVRPQVGGKADMTILEETEQAPDMIILPLRMESLSGHPSLLERLQTAEYTAIQELTVSSAQKGRPVMCSGANMIVRRKAWLACEGDLHPEIPSGDDMFLLEAMKKRGMRIAVTDEEDYTAVVRPADSWRSLWHQRTRWAGKAPHYTDRDIRLAGGLTLTLMLLQIICPLFWIPNLAIELSLLRRAKGGRGGYTAGDVVLLSLVYPYYSLACVAGGLLSKRIW